MPLRALQLAERRRRGRQILFSMRGPPALEGDGDGTYEPDVPGCVASHRGAVGGLPAFTASSRPTAVRSALRVRTRTRRRERAIDHQTPLVPALFSIDLEQEARLEDHEKRLRDLEQVFRKRRDRRDGYRRFDVPLYRSVCSDKRLTS
jgi:hypothetical protein